jgi:plasmid maintenance system antidote protein VapI
MSLMQTYKKQKLGELLDRAKRQDGLTKVKIAQRMDIPRTLISNHVAPEGKAHSDHLTDEWVARYCEALGITEEEFYEEFGAEVPARKFTLEDRIHRIERMLESLDRTPPNKTRKKGLA